MQPTAKSTHSTVWFWLVLAAIVAVAAVLRLYRLGEVPQRFDADEFSFGYEAWSLWSTGMDQHGNLLPLHIRGFNDYSLGLPFYTTAPFVGLLGLSEFSARLPFALMGILTVWVTALLGRRWFGAGAGLIAALLLACEPWHIHLTRIAFMVGFVPFFVTLSLYSFTRLLESLHASTSRRAQWGWAFTCALSFALLTYSYVPMKVQAPLLLIGCIVAGWSLLRANRWIALGWIAMMALLLVPMSVDHLLHNALLQQHFRQVSIIGEDDWLIRVVRNYVQQFDPSRLFFDGLNRQIDYKPATGIGELFWLEGPLWIVVFATWVRNPRRWLRVPFNLPVLLAIWFLTYPAASSVTFGPTSHRQINLLPLPELLAGLGMMIVINWLVQLKTQRSMWWRPAVYTTLFTSIFLFAAFNLLFVRIFFAPPLLETPAPAERIPYNAGLPQVIDYLNRAAQPCDQIYFEYTYQGYIYYLFYTHYPPARFQKAPIFKKESSDGWLVIIALDNLRFNDPFTKYDVLPPRPDYCKGKPSHSFFAVKSGQIVDPSWQTVFTVDNARGAAIWHVQMQHDDF